MLISSNAQILVGGSTRIPEIRQRLENKFGKDKLKFDINPDETVAYGAAIAANSPEVPLKIFEKVPENFPMGLNSRKSISRKNFNGSKMSC